MSEALGLGQLITTPQQRDCIHIAVVPVIAGEMLRPGQKVMLRGTNHVVIKATDSTFAVGVIDPYLNVPVLQGQECWLYMNPGSITSLRHDWTHPALG